MANDTQPRLELFPGIMPQSANIAEYVTTFRADEIEENILIDNTPIPLTQPLTTPEHTSEVLNEDYSHILSFLQDNDDPTVNVVGTAFWYESMLPESLNTNHIATSVTPAAFEQSNVPRLHSNMPRGEDLTNVCENNMVPETSDVAVPRKLRSGVKRKTTNAKRKNVKSKKLKTNEENVCPEGVSVASPSRSSRSSRSVSPLSALSSNISPTPQEDAVSADPLVETQKQDDICDPGVVVSEVEVFSEIEKVEVISEITENVYIAAPSNQSSSLVNLSTEMFPRLFMDNPTPLSSISNIMSSLNCQTTLVYICHYDCVDVKSSECFDLSCVKISCIKEAKISDECKVRYSKYFKKAVLINMYRLSARIFVTEDVIVRAINSKKLPSDILEVLADKKRFEDNICTTVEERHQSEIVKLFGLIPTITSCFFLTYLSHLSTCDKEKLISFMQNEQTLAIARALPAPFTKTQSTMSGADVNVNQQIIDKIINTALGVYDKGNPLFFSSLKRPDNLKVFNEISEAVMEHLFLHKSDKTFLSTKIKQLAFAKQYTYPEVASAFYKSNHFSKCNILHKGNGATAKEFLKSFYPHPDIDTFCLMKHETEVNRRLTIVKHKQTVYWINSFTNFSAENLVLDHAHLPEHKNYTHYIIKMAKVHDNKSKKQHMSMLLLVYSLIVGFYTLEQFYDIIKNKFNGKWLDQISPKIKIQVFLSNKDVHHTLF